MPSLYRAHNRLQLAMGGFGLAGSWMAQRMYNGGVEAWLACADGSHKAWRAFGLMSTWLTFEAERVKGRDGLYEEGGSC